MSWAGGGAVTGTLLYYRTQKGTLPKIMVGEYSIVSSVYIGGYFRHRMVTFQLLAKKAKSIVLPLLQH